MVCRSHVYVKGHHSPLEWTTHTNSASRKAPAAFGHITRSIMLRGDLPIPLRGSAQMDIGGVPAIRAKIRKTDLLRSRVI